MSNVAVVTGASSGFGEQFARRFARAGDDLVVARRRDRLEALQRPSSPPSLTIGLQHRINALGARLVPRRIVLAIAARTAAGPENA